MYEKIFGLGSKQSNKSIDFTMMCFFQNLKFPEVLIFLKVSEKT